ncbi:type I-E CRISPR-associated protein Cas5/CasD [Streptomyces sp. NPDC001820]|uniref:type I-E CRISPR-associated protein Cas5/CasD n=1 Tax=Streptomyces sp. NPDC001820 TaxID=3364613 RepID=UPI0036BFB2E2
MTGNNSHNAATGSGLLLRLAGPLSAYGTYAAFTHRDTAPHPTRSALIGMFAAAAGRPGPEALLPHHDLPGEPSYHDLTFTIRIDRPGTVHTDYHVTGGGYPRSQQLRTSSGGRRPPNESALPSHRDYLADAAFTIAVEGPPPLIARIADHLEHPHWAPYLGRRCCIPDEPLVLGSPRTDPVEQLLHHVPLTLARPPRPGCDTVPVGFVWEQPPAHTGADSQHELPDDPVDFTRAQRRHRTRLRWRTTEQLPTALYAGPHPLHALAAYLAPEAPCTPQP